MKKLLLLSLSLIVLNPIFAQKKKDKKNPGSAPLLQPQ
jgi:hypothetical protein